MTYSKALFATDDFLSYKENACTSRGFRCPQWINFCRKLTSAGLSVKVYEARKTRSKYIYIKSDKDSPKVFKVRFSNHFPANNKVDSKDSDFYVGISKLGAHTTSDAIKAVNEFFNIEIKWGKN